MEVTKRMLSYMAKRPRRDFFDVIDSEEKAYWLGFLWADGHVPQSGSFVRVSLGEKDDLQMQRLAGMFGTKVMYCGAVDKRSGRKYVQGAVAVNSVYLGRRLQSMGFVHNKTMVDDWPVLSFVGEGLLRHFIRGFFDGDGCISFTEKYRHAVCSFYGASLKSMELLRDLLVAKIGVSVCKVTGCEGVVKDARIQWSSREDLGKLYRFMYDVSVVCLERKKQRFQEAFVMLETN